MKMIILYLAVALTVCMSKPVLAEPSAGAAGFEANCAECHPGGRNIVNPAKDLRTMTLKANGILTARDIVAKMRKPGPGMMKFPPQELPDKEALEIAEYVLATFK